jgi:hypothetical protein
MGRSDGQQQLDWDERLLLVSTRPAARRTAPATSMDVFEGVIMFSAFLFSTLDWLFVLRWLLIAR